jgi:iron complex outermembrane recepter protein
MNKILLHHVGKAAVLLMIFSGFKGYSQTSSWPISGYIFDKASNSPLQGATVSLKGTVSGTISDKDGAFRIETSSSGPTTIVISFIGFKTVEQSVSMVSGPLTIELEENTYLGQEIVVTASRLEESILKSPVAIEKMDIRAIRESPASSFYDALENLKGVQMTTSSLTFKVPNTRGFNIPNNFRFMQMVDGVDMQAATLGVPLGNAIGPTELDIESVEVTPGAASALYGMNAINGMANMQTKSPFLYQGLSLYQKTAINHVDGVDREPGILTETAIRYAKAYNNRLAFKVNASYLRGTDWLANTTTDQNPNDGRSTANAGFQQLSGNNNPAYDGWNKYGDENNNAITIGGIQYEGQRQTFLVRRTGYWEKDLVNPRVENMKLDGALHYKLSEKAELSYQYRVGRMDGVFQRGNKIQLDNVVVQNHKVELKGADFFIRGYLSSENTGDSYNLKPLADNLQLTDRSNNEWKDIFSTELQTQLNAGLELTSAMASARSAADNGRLNPGTPEFENMKRAITKINNWDHASQLAGAPATGGAWLKQRSRMYHTEAQWNLSEKILFFDLLIGVDARLYEVIPDGNNFVDFSRPLEERTTPGGRNVYYAKYGMFAQATKRLFAEHLKLSGSLRFDHNLDFSPKINPRLAAVYTLAQNHNFRTSYQNGFRFPALFEALSFVNNGNVRRVGGLAFINEGLGYLDNSYTLASVNAFNSAANKDINSGVSPAQAAARNMGLLQVTNLSPTTPERINSFEAGYKSILLNNSLVLDIDGYVSIYDSFLGQVEVSVPSTDLVGTESAAIDMLASNRGKQTRYRVFTNARSTYKNYGSAVGLTYNFYRKFTLGGNLNFNNIAANKEQDVFLTAFNTPKWVTNISFGNREVVQNVGFNIVWRWQSSFEWESPLANGVVPSYYTFDAQITCLVPQLNARVKAGGLNILNRRYIQYAAGPTIGGLYYVAITFDGLFNG